MEICDEVGTADHHQPMAEEGDLESSPFVLSKVETSKIEDEERHQP